MRVKRVAGEKRRRDRSVGTRARRTGWVRSGEDGTVHIHAEGAQRSVDELAAFLRDGPPLSCVDGVQIDQVAEMPRQPGSDNGCGRYLGIWGFVDD